MEDFCLSPDLESAAAEVYKLANRRALDRIRLLQEGCIDMVAGTEEDTLVQRLQLAKTMEGKKDEKVDVLTSAIARDKEEAEELLDLIKGGRAAEAAKLGLRVANYLRSLVDQRGWGPSVLFITE